MADDKDLPPVWEALARASKHQQLLVLQRAFDTVAEDMGLYAPTIATLSLLKLVLALGFRMKSWEHLTTVLHPFVAPPSESQIPDPAVTSSDPYNNRLSVIRRTSGIRFYLSYALARTYL